MRLHTLYITENTGKHISCPSFCLQVDILVVIMRKGKSCDEMKKKIERK